MQDKMTPYSTAQSYAAESRADFIWKCYAHVVVAILAFAAIEVYLFSSGVAMRIAAPMMNNWLLVLGAFIVVGWGATHLAHRLESKSSQYAAFAVFIVAEALIFAPLLMVAMAMDSSGSMIESAAGVTVLGSVGLIATAMITRKDFSFLRGLLVWAGILALVGIVSALIFGFQLGTWFSLAMIGLAGAAVLYDTSNIIHHYPADRYVAASMALFASIAMMFWYVLRLFMSRD